MTGPERPAAATASAAAAACIRTSAWLVPGDERDEFLREWRTELAWCVHDGRTAAEQRRRALGAWRHAAWLRFQRLRGHMIRQDIRYAWRALAARPALSLVALASLTLGIGGNVAIFSVINGVLLAPLPFSQPDRLMQLANAESAATLSGPELVDIQRDVKTLGAVGAYAFADGNVTGGRGDAERVRIARVTAGFFDALGPGFAAGRPFAAAEDRPGAADVVVISAGLASRYFGDIARAAGGTIDVSGVRRQVVGVLPAGFSFPAAAVDIWAPMALDPASPGERRNHQYRLVGRLAPGATLASVQAEMDAFRAGWERAYPELYDPKRPLIMQVMSLSDRIVGTSRPYLYAMFGAVGVVLLIACVNVASLLLTYGETRRRDMALAVALGASRARLARRALAESALLAAGGGVLGVALAVPASRALVALAPASVPRLDRVGIDPTVLAFAVLAAALAAIVSGLAPLLRTFGSGDTALLRSAGRSGAPAGGRSTRWTHGALVVAEIALAVVLLCCAGLLSRSLLNLQHLDLGYDPSRVFTARITMPRATYPSPRATGAVQQVVERLSALPGVERAAAMAWTPLIDGGGMWSIAGEAGPAPAGSLPFLAAPQQATPGFFEALSMPVRGRGFTWSDRADTELVAVVNAAFGRMLWQDQDPIGHRFRMDSPDAKWVTVVGVVADSRVDGLVDAKPPVMYFPYAQAKESAYFTSPTMTLVVKHAGEAAGLERALRAAVRDMDPNVPVSDARSFDTIVGSVSATERFTAVLVSAFAALAAILAGIGIYGVIAFGVAQQQFEIGLKMALGASRARVFGAVARRGIWMAAAGLAIGAAGSIGAGRLLASVLYDVRPFEPLVLAAVALVLLAVVCAALALPARRAMTVSPTNALR